MKKGDKILCKKTKKFIDRVNKITFMFEGISYIVLNTTDNIISVIIDEIIIHFSTIKIGSSFFIYDYFYTIEELRLLKLKSL